MSLFTRLIEAEANFKRAFEEMVSDQLNHSLGKLKDGIEDRLKDFGVGLRAVQTSINQCSREVAGATGSSISLTKALFETFSGTSVSGFKEDLADGIGKMVIPAVVGAVNGLRDGMGSSVFAGAGSSIVPRSFAEVASSLESAQTKLGSAPTDSLSRKMTEVQSKLPSSVPTVIIRYRVDGTSSQCRDFL